MMKARRYNAPGFKVGRYFVRDLSNELQGVQEHKWNRDNFIIF